MGKTNRGLLRVSRDIFAEIFEYLLKEKISGVDKFSIVSMKKLKYSDTLEVEISIPSTSSDANVSELLDAKGRIILGEFRGRDKLPPGEFFKRSRIMGRKIEEMDLELIPVKPTKASNSNENMLVGIAIEDCKKGDMVSIATGGTVTQSDDLSDSAAITPKKTKGDITVVSASRMAGQNPLMDMAKHKKKFTKPKKKKIKKTRKDFMTKSFDSDHEVPF